MPQLLILGFESMFGTQSASLPHGLPFVCSDSSISVVRCLLDRQRHSGELFQQQRQPQPWRLWDLKSHTLPHLASGAYRRNPASLCNKLTTAQCPLAPGPGGGADLSVWLYLDGAAVLPGIHSSLVRQATEGQVGNPKWPGWT